MARSDYAHWNEDQDLMWWQEEGRFQGQESEMDYCDQCGGCHSSFECPGFYDGEDGDEEDEEDEEEGEAVGEERSPQTEW